MVSGDLIVRINEYDIDAKVEERLTAPKTNDSLSGTGFRESASVTVSFDAWKSSQKFKPLTKRSVACARQDPERSKRRQERNYQQISRGTFRFE